MRTAEERAKTAEVAGMALTKIIAGQDITEDEKNVIEERKKDHEEWKEAVKEA